MRFFYQVKLSIYYTENQQTKMIDYNFSYITIILCNFSYVTESYPSNMTSGDVFMISQDVLNLLLEANKHCVTIKRNFLKLI